MLRRRLRQIVGAFVVGTIIIMIIIMIITVI